MKFEKTTLEGKYVCLKTKRLILRQWRDEDYEPFARLNADPKVMEHFPSTLTKVQSDVMATTLKTLISQNGWGFWVMEEKETGLFVGALGLHEPTENLPFLPCVEIGWRLAYEHWGKGYATEAGKEVLRYAFEDLKLEEVVSFTAVANKRSRDLMKRLGMKNSYENFEHSALPQGHRLREHVLYKISKDEVKS
jgi:RimJ/RimL family protein N-acetyltransferase